MSTETIWYAEALRREPSGRVVRKQISHNLPRRAAAEMVAAEAEASARYMLVSVVQGLGRPVKVCGKCCRALEFRSSRPMRCVCERL